MKLKQILENQILVPRRSKEERNKNLVAVHYKQIQEHIKNGSKGNLDLENSPLKVLPPNLIKVGGFLNLIESNIIDLGNLKHVGYSLYLQDSKINSLGNLEYVGMDLWLQDSQIKDLGKLERVEGSLYLRNTPLESLGNLEYVGYSFNLFNTPISKHYTIEQIKQQVVVWGDISL